MSFYSLGKNEVRFLMQKEAQMRDELQKMSKSNMGGNSIMSFQAIKLQNEIKKIHNKIQVLTCDKHFDDDDIA